MHLFWGYVSGLGGAGDVCGNCGVSDAYGCTSYRDVYGISVKDILWFRDASDVFGLGSSYVVGDVCGFSCVYDCLPFASCSCLRFGTF